MRKSHNYVVLAILTLAFVMLFGIANTACYGEVEIHCYQSSSGSRYDSGDGYFYFSSWDHDDSYSIARAEDGPTWSTAVAATGSDNAVTFWWTTGGTGTELLIYDWSLYIDGKINGNARNDDPETTGYGWASAGADAAVELNSPYSEDDVDESISFSLYDSATEPGYVVDEDDDYIEGDGTCYANAMIIVDHDCYAVGYIDTDADYMTGYALAEVSSYLGLSE
jgi:hypothetical protein